MSDAAGLLVRRDDLHATRWSDDHAVASAALPDGGVRLRVTSFALTSNNVTYAAFGESMRYWDFFPADEPGWGRVPVWGFADVLESRCAGVERGERLYGYWPMASHALLQPVDVGVSGFVDGAPHRHELHPLYNRYRRCRTDPGYEARHEAEQALLQPLFATAFLIDDMLAEQGFFGAESVLLSSASSKTAYATAFCIGQREQRPRLVGLTSAGNLGFAQSLGCYDEVIVYDEVAAQPVRPAVYVDFAGSAPLRASVHHHWADALGYSCAVGGTHWEELGGAGGLPGPRPQLFFAPAQMKKRQADWGSAGLQQRIAQRWLAFVQRVTDPAAPWLLPVHRQGRDAVRAAWFELLEGRSDPRQGLMLGL